MAIYRQTSIEGYNTTEASVLSVDQVDEMKSEPPEDKEMVEQNQNNYKDRLLRLHHEINVKQIELDALRLQTKNTFDDISHLKSQEMDVIIDRHQLFFNLSDK